MIHIKINITGAHPPFRYRLKGSAEWQDSNVFEVPALTGAGSYTFEVIDDTDCISEFTIEEQFLTLLSVGATSHTGSVIARWNTTEEAESKIWWGIDPEDLTETDWNGVFTKTHALPFPISFIGSNHYFRAASRTKLGQYRQSVIVGLYALGDEVVLDDPAFITEAQMETIEPEIINAQTTGINVIVSTNFSKINIDLFTEVSIDVVATGEITLENNGFTTKAIITLL